MSDIKRTMFGVGSIEAYLLNDPYHPTFDNRPIQNLLDNDVVIGDEDFVFTGEKQFSDTVIFHDTVTHDVGTTINIGPHSITSNANQLIVTATGGIGYFNVNSNLINLNSVDYININTSNATSDITIQSADTLSIYSEDIISIKHNSGIAIGPIIGTKKLTIDTDGTIYPEATTSDLGKLANPWGEVHTQDLYVNNQVKTNLIPDGDLSLGDPTHTWNLYVDTIYHTGDIVPVTASQDLGHLTAYPWDNIYGKHLYLLNDSEQFGLYSADGSTIYGSHFAGSSSYTISSRNTVPLIFAINLSEVARFDSNGNFGIDENSPQARLHINSSGVKQLQWDYNNSFQLGSLGINNSAGCIRLYNNSAEEKVSIHANDTSYFNGGSVVIGGTSAGNNKLAIYQNLINPSDHIGIYFNQNYEITSTDTDYTSGFLLYKIKYDIPTGITSNGYQRGASIETYINDTNFQGTINLHQGLVIRSGINQAAASGERTINTEHALYIESLANAGTITNNYAIYQTGPSTVKNYFSGNIGIGITQGDGTLHVHTGSAGSVTANVIADDLVVENSGSGGYSILVPDNYQSIYALGSPSSSVGSFVSWQFNTKQMNIGTNVTGGFITFSSNQSVEAMRITSDRLVGIGEDNPQSSLHISDQSPRIIIGTDASIDSITSSLYMKATNTGDAIDRETAEIVAGYTGTAYTTSYLRFRTLNASAVLTDTLTITNNNVGIKVTDPSVALQINGQSTFTCGVAGVSAFSDLDGLYKFWSYGPIQNPNNITVSILQEATTNNSKVFECRSGSATYSSANSLFSVYANGKVGIGTNYVPEGKFEIYQLTGGPIARFYYSNDSGAASELRFVKDRTTGGTITSGDNLGLIGFYGHNGSGLTEGARIHIVTEGTIATNRVPSHIRFYTHGDGAGDFKETIRMEPERFTVRGDNLPSSTLMIGTDFGTDNTSRTGKITTNQYADADAAIGVAGLWLTADATTNHLALGGGTVYDYAATEISFWTAGDNVTTVGTKKMLINSVGRVGINSSSPGSYLTVGGQVQVEGNGHRRYAISPSYFGFSTDYRVLLIGSDSTTYNQQDTGSITLSFGYDTTVNSNSSFTGNGHELIFRNGASFITSNSTNDGWHHDYIVLKDGTVGIGNSSPEVALHLAGIFKISTAIVDSFEDRFYFYCGGASDPAQFTMYDENEIAKVYITANGASYFNGGSLGIGITPASPLHVHTSDSDNALFITTNGTTRDLYTLYQEDRDGTPITWSTGYDASDDAFKISNSTTLGTNDALSIKDYSGNRYVGINVSIPDAWLQIGRNDAGTGSIQNILHLGSVGGTTGVAGDKFRVQISHRNTGGTWFHSAIDSHIDVSGNRSNIILAPSANSSSPIDGVIITHHASNTTSVGINTYPYIDIDLHVANPTNAKIVLEDTGGAANNKKKVIFSENGGFYIGRYTDAWVISSDLFINSSGDATFYGNISATNLAITNWNTAYSERRQWDGGNGNLNASLGRTSLGLGTMATQNSNSVSITGGSIGTSVTQTNWDTAYSERRQWDGGSTNLNAATGRTSLGLGSMALEDTSGWVDYSGTISVVGFSSFSVKSVYYRTIGNTVFLFFRIEGTSNSTSHYLTSLPFSANISLFSAMGMYGISNNNGTYANGSYSFNGAGTIAYLYYGFPGGAFSNGVPIQMHGYIIYAKA